MIKISLLSNSGTTPPFYQNDNFHSFPSQTGAVQWNGYTKKFQVSTGAGWFDIDNNINLAISTEYEEIMKWAKSKMEEDKKLEALVKLYPAVADAKQHLDNVINLVQ